MKAPLFPMSAKLKKILEKAESTAASYLRSEGELLLDLIEVEKEKAFRCFGYPYLTTYVREELHIGEHVASILVRIVNKSIEVPELAQAVVNGDLELTKAKTIASVITKENKDEWLAKA